MMLWCLCQEGATIVGLHSPPHAPCSLPCHRRACYGVLRFVMESGAKGCEVIVSGKLRAARAKSMKFKDGYMVSSGHPARVYIDSAVRHVLLRQGVLGIKVGAGAEGGMRDWVGCGIRPNPVDGGALGLVCS